MYRSVTDIAEREHVGMVREIFSTITRRYDFLNHLLSIGRDIAWRKFTVQKMRFFQTNRLLDIATGTADLAIEAAKTHSHIDVMAADFVPEMMAVGRRKIERNHLSHRVHLLQNDALQLAFPPNTFDVAAIAFGVRNIPHRVRLLREMHRVVIPQGQVMILEMSVPRKRLFRGLHHIYVNRIIPLVARAFSTNPAAYEYLADSIIHAPTPEEVTRLMARAGLTAIEQFPLTRGMTWLHIGVKPE